jgi:hypothetical protein
MTVDELLTNPVAACDLPDGAIPLHAIVLIEYAEPGSDTVPQRSRLAHYSDDEISLWTSIGMLRFALALELGSVSDIDEAP